MISPLFTRCSWTTKPTDSRSYTDLKFTSTHLVSLKLQLRFRYLKYLLGLRVPIVQSWYFWGKKEVREVDISNRVGERASKTLTRNTRSIIWSHRTTDCTHQPDLDTSAIRRTGGRHKSSLSAKLPSSPGLSATWHHLEGGRPPRSVNSGAPRTTWRHEALSSTGYTSEAPLYGCYAA